MRSMCLADCPSGLPLVERSVPQPKPGRGEVLIRVHAAGITPSELVWYPTSHTAHGDPRTGAVPAHEFSGEIAGLGEGVAGLSVGEQVYGMNDWFADGALADYCLTQPEWIAPKPSRLSHADSASVPIGALTAWQGLFERAKLRAGERLLVHGGAGAVGIFAVQMAHACGAHVITTVSAADVEFVKELGAAETIDYRATRFEDQLRDLDVVFDTVGGDTLERSWSVLKADGRLVTIAASGETTSNERAKQAFFIVETKRQQLVEVARLLDAGQLRTIVGAVLPLSQASAAYSGKVEKKGRGKVVVAVDGFDELPSS